MCLSATVCPSTRALQSGADPRPLAHHVAKGSHLLQHKEAGQHGEQQWSLAKALLHQGPHLGVEGPARCACWEHSAAQQDTAGDQACAT